MAISLKVLQTILWVESTLLRIARQGGAQWKARICTGILGCVAALLIPAAASAAGLAEISNQDAVAGLKEALTRGSRAAVTRLGVEDGFFRNGSVKIALPPSLRRVEAVMRSIGMDRTAAEAVLTMNRRAQAAVPAGGMRPARPGRHSGGPDGHGPLDSARPTRTECVKAH